MGKGFGEKGEKEKKRRSGDWDRLGKEWRLREGVGMR